MEVLKVPAGFHLLSMNTLVGISTIFRERAWRKWPGLLLLHEYETTTGVLMKPKLFPPVNVVGIAYFDAHVVQDILSVKHVVL